MKGITAKIPKTRKELQALCRKFHCKKENLMWTLWKNGVKMVA